MAKTKETIAGFRDKFRLNSHYEIERFGIMFFTLLGTLAIILTTLVVSAVKNNAETLGTKAIYTQTFKTSKTEINGSTEGVYVNAARTKSMILMHMSDAASFSQDPNKYQAFVTASNIEGGDKDLKNNFTGSIGVFGSTGYIGVFLDSDTPIASDILSITVRSTSQLVPSKGKEALEATDDRTFAEFDQWRIYVNPGASEAEVLPALNGTIDNFGDLYYESVLYEQENEMRDQLNVQLDHMQVALRAADEYEAQLLTLSTVDGVKVVPEEAPLVIRGDKVTGELPIVTTDVESEEDGEDVNIEERVTPQSSTSSDPQSNGSSDGNNVLRLHSDVDIPGGLNFNWQDGTIRDGYIDKLLGPDTSFVDFLAQKAKESSDSDIEPVSGSSIEWKLSNGKMLTDYSKEPPMDVLFDQTNLVTQAWINYYQLKSDYEKKMLNDLLTLEYNYKLVVQNGAMSNSDDSVIFY